MKYKNGMACVAAAIESVALQRHIAIVIMAKYYTIKECKALT